MRQRGYLTFLSACFLAIVSIVPLADAAIEILRDGRSPTIAALFSRVPSEENLRSLESDLESSSWFPQALRPWWQRLRFALLGDLGEKAVLGRDGGFTMLPTFAIWSNPSLTSRLAQRMTIRCRRSSHFGISSRASGFAC